MHKLSAYQHQIVLLYTDKGVQLFGTPLNNDPEQPGCYLFQVLALTQDEATVVSFTNEEIGYIVELPEEIEQGLRKTSDFWQQSVSTDLLNTWMSSHQFVEFGVKNKRERE
ncbi:hypothetical protein ACX93W_22065 [Paenibacillus sp. CAU 1782]